MSKKAVEGWQYITGEEKKPETAREKAEIRARELQRKVASAGRQAESDTKREAGRLEAEANRAAGQVQAGASRAINTIKEKAAQAKGAISGSTNSAIDTAGSAPAVAVSLRDRALEATQDAMNRTKDLAQEAKSKFDEVSSNLPFNFSEGVEGIVREAEKALRQGEAKIEEVVERGTTPTTPATSPEIGSRGFAETQRPRELHPETVQPQKPSNEGKEIYTGPPLPLGHEPPPGYYIAPLAKSREDKGDSQDEKFRQVLPLLVPKIREFAKEEPIISQLASTIDSLAASLSAPSSSPSADANGILSKAQDDLTSLSQRLEDVKRAEREKLEQTVSEKTRLFEASLQEKDEERQKGEHGLREGWDKERQRMVDDWRHALESELETQRTGIEQR